jgi:hypothetical protein
MVLVGRSLVYDSVAGGALESGEVMNGSLGYSGGNRPVLHVHNGDSTAKTLREFGFPGEHRAFQEVLMEGPTPSGLSSDEWIGVRAGFLAGAYQLELDKAERDLKEQQAWLAKSTDHDEIVLWFEHDLFCQINLIYLLDWFSKQSLGNSKLSLICTNAFPGIEDFRGLGQLTGAQLASLFDRRHEVSDDETITAVRSWSAYCSTDPTEITRVLLEDTSSMPFLRTALSLHLARFPSLRNGLGRLENKALEIISNGPIRFKALFPAFAKAEPVYGLGDLQLWCALRRLGKGRDPLITISGIDGQFEFPNSCHLASFDLTETGRAVLSGERDLITTNGIDLWLGGVHLIGSELWRWDERNGLITATTT